MAALHDQAGCRDHAVDALLARQPRILLDTVDRHLGRAPEDREHRAIFQEVDRIVAPFAGSDHPPIESENAVQLTAVECNLAGDAGLAVTRAPARLARIGFAEAHAAPPSGTFQLE